MAIALIMAMTTSVSLLVLFTDFLPFSGEGYAAQRFALCLVVTLVACVLLPFGFLVGSYKSGFPRGLYLQDFLVILVPLAFVILGVLSGMHGGYGWVEVGMYALYFLSLLLLGNWLGVNANILLLIKLFCGVIVTSCFFYAAMTVNVYLFALGDRVTSFSDYIPWGFINIRYWSHIATWVLPLFPLAVLVVSFRYKRLWCFAVHFSAAVWWWIVFMSMARGTLLSLVLAASTVSLLIQRPALPWLKLFFKQAAGGVILWGLLSVTIPALVTGHVEARGVSVSTSGRLPLFAEAWEMSWVNFPFGMGAQSWLTHETITGDYQAAGKIGHPHNMYLLWAAEYGWLCVAAVFLFIGSSVKDFFVARRYLLGGVSGELAAPAVAFSVAATAALIHANVSAVFMAPASMLVGLLVLGFARGVLQSIGRGERQSHKSAFRDCRGSMPKALAFSGVYITLFFLLMLVASLWLKQVWVYYLDMKVDEATYGEYVREATFPRFWFHGNYPRDEAGAVP